jgi:hypothetical protein
MRVVFSAPKSAGARALILVPGQILIDVLKQKHTGSKVTNLLFIGFMATSYDPDDANATANGGG